MREPFPVAASALRRSHLVGLSDPIRYWSTRISSAKGGIAMPICDVCGNDYDKAFQVVMGGSTHTFDSFECAVHALAPRCAHCGVKVVGHGLESQGAYFCCAHCATAEGVEGMADRK